MKLDPKFLKTALSLLGSFNEEQTDAILVAKNLLIDAVAGCGKTRTLAGTICAKILTGANPEKIGVASYTTIAAEEIASRAEDLTFKANGNKEPESTFARGTFHSIARQELIRGNHNRSRWKILPDEQAKDLWSQAASFCASGIGNGRIAGSARHTRNRGTSEDGETQKEEKDSNNDPLMETASATDLLRNMGMAKDMVRTILDAIWPEGLAVENTNARIHISQIERKYREIKELRSFLDYTDLLELWLEMLKESPEQKNRWEHFLVDEYQDTNPLQLQILGEIHKHGAELVACGDTNQCIAGFNGSDPLAQEKFNTEIGMQHRELVTNYRSTPQILDLGNSILSQGILPPGKDHPSMMYPGPNAGSGRIPKLIECMPGDAVNATLDAAAEMYNTLKAQGEEYPQVAILYRDNNRGNQIEEAALKRTGQSDFPPVERRDRRKSEDIRKVESELSRIIQWWSEPSGNKGKALFKSIISSSWFPQTGDVKATSITNAMRCEITGPEKAWKSLAKLIPNRITGHVGYMIQAWEHAKMQSSMEKCDQISCKAAASAMRTFISDWCRHEKEMNHKFEELVTTHHENFLLQIEQFGNEPVAGLLRSRALAEQSEAGRNAQEASYSGLVLSTFHLAKGKEYEGVVLHHVNPGVLPNARAINDDGYNNLGIKGLRKLAATAKAGVAAGVKPTELLEFLKMQINSGNYNEPQKDISDPLEEERRLFYVGVTRAKKELALVMEKPKGRNSAPGESGNNLDPVPPHPFIPIKNWIEIGGTNPEVKKDESTGIYGL